MVHRRGLTLWELVIVLAIMATLIGLMGPTLAQARSTSQTTECTNNLKELGVLHLEQTWETNVWARSAYDLHGSRWSQAVSGPIKSNDKQAVHNSAMPPIPRDVSQMTRLLHEAEETAPPQPRYWMLPCPEAIMVQQQSYGMNYDMQNIKENRILSNSIVFACSPYRLIIQTTDLEPTRHGAQVTVLFGNMSVSQKTPDIFPDTAETATLWRPLPLPAEYPGF